MPWKRMLAYVSGSVDENLLKQIDYLIEENRVLREQLSGRPKLNDAQRRHLTTKAMALGKLMASTVTIVKPDTIMRWHRRLIANKFDGSNKRKYGRPSITPHIQKLIISMATDNPSWGYDRIAGAIQNLGHQVSDQAVGNILRGHGIPSAPDRKRNTSWSQFIRQHKEVLWATDFLTTEVWTHLGLTTFYILFFINLKTRQVVIGGITRSPNKVWMEQVARNCTDWDSPMYGAHYLIHDRDTKYTESFGNVFQSINIAPLKLPPQSPNLNAYAERFVRSMKSECLDRLILFGEMSLRHVIGEYMAHYHSERNHQGLENVIPFPDHRHGLVEPGKVIHSERLGGLLSFYHKPAA
jgi:transposase InsO family protein